jgi:hypothetical protein
MFQNGVHGNDVKCGVGKCKSLGIGGNIGNGLIDSLGFQGPGMKVGPVGVVTFLAKEPGTPAVAAPHIQNSARSFAGVLQHEFDITAVVLGGLFGAACKHSANVRRRISVQDLDAVQVHGLTDQFGSDTQVQIATKL